MSMAIIPKHISLRAILGSITICVIPTINAFVLATETTTNLLQLQPSRSSQIINRHQSIMIQQQQQQSNAESTDAINAEHDSSSTVLPTTTTTPFSLFSPTSKYQNGLAQRRRWLVVDFDGTCTEHDTTPLLPRLAALVAAATTRQSSSSMDHNHKNDLQRRLSQFQTLEDEFMKRHREAQSTILSNDNNNGSSGGEEEQSIHDALDILDKPSNIVTQMVSESRVLEGLGHVDAHELKGMLQLYGVTSTADTADNDIDSANKEMDSANNNAEDEEVLEKIVVRLRHGCESTLARILLDKDDNNNDNRNRKEGPPSCLGWSLAVLSINWCPALINASLVQPVLNKRRSILRVNSCETEIPIWSNHVDGEGTVTLHVPGALAKRDRIRELRKHMEQSDSSNVIVYVGDSSTDLAALLEADIGILIGNSSSTTTIAERWGIRIVPLKDRRQHGLGGSSLNDEDGVGNNWRKEKILWQVKSWQEIDELLIELDEHWR